MHIEQLMPLMNFVILKMEKLKYVLDRNFMSDYSDNGEVFKIKNLLNVNEYILEKVYMELIILNYKI